MPEALRWRGSSAVNSLRRGMGVSGLGGDFDVCALRVVSALTLTLGVCVRSWVNLQSAA